MNLFETISERMTITEVLDMFGISAVAGRNTKCPIHRGEDNNFLISRDDSSFKCFSHNCGGKYSRDSLNLYCLMKHGQSLPELDRSQKKQTLDYLCNMLGVDQSEHRTEYKPKTFIDSIPSRAERLVIKTVLSNTLNLKIYARSWLFSSAKARKIILYLEVARSENQLPAVVNGNWIHYENMIKYLKGA